MQFEILHYFLNDEEYAIEIRIHGSTLCRFNTEKYRNYLNENNPYIQEAVHRNLFIVR